MLGEALKGERRETLEIFTKVYWPTGPGGKNDTGLSRKHIMESINGSLRRLQTDYVDLYQAHRYDTETPLDETMQAFADIVRQGKALYIGVREWTADQIRAGAELSATWHPAHLEPAAVLDAVAGHRGRGHPDERGARGEPDRLQPVAQGMLTGKYLPGQPVPEGSRATDEKGGADFIEAVPARRRPRAGPGAPAGRRPGRDHDGPARRRLGAAQPPERRLRDHRRVRTEQVTENVRAAGVRLAPGADRPRRRSPRRCRRAGRQPDPGERPGKAPGPSVGANKHRPYAAEPCPPTPADSQNHILPPPRHG